MTEVAMSVAIGRPAQYRMGPGAGHDPRRLRAAATGAPMLSAGVATPPSWERPLHSPGPPPEG